MLIYIHVPFCRRKCDYCGFHSRPHSDLGMSIFLDGLKRETALWSKRLQRPAVETVYIGGGTPSMLDLRALQTIMADLRKGFKLADNAEITMEANPESARRSDYMAAVRSMGVNRLSLGVQSLQPRFLQTLGRPHTPRMAVDAYMTARTAGFANVSLDLIWGIPGQRLKLWLDDLKRVVELGPDHISCYSLTLEPDTRMEQRCLTGEVELPGEDEQSKMFLYGADYLEANGYLQYEISNFARMGFTSRHNLGYWEGADYLGMGPSAVSTVLDWRWTNPEDLEAYAAAATSGALGKDPEQLTPAMRLRELVMLSLRTSRGLSFKEYARRTGRKFLKDFEVFVAALHRNDLIRISKGRLRLTRSGMLVSNTILGNMFDHLETLEQAGDSSRPTMD